MTGFSGLTLLASAIVLVTVLLLMLIYELHIRSMNSRVANAVGKTDEFAPIEDTTEWLSSVGMRYRRFYSTASLEQLRTIIQTSGFNPHRTLMMIVGARTVAIFLFPLLGLFIGEVTRGSLRDVGGYILLGAVIGILGPQWILSYIRKRYNAAVNRGTPDAIDLLVVCSEAGMGLESALERVAEEMHLSNPQIAKVLTGLIDDLRVLPNRRDAFDNLAKRSTENGLRRFGIMVNQSLQYGTPLSHALRAIAEELRKERLIKLEERAHKLAVKLTLPMVFFMLPAMFITLGGSSFLHLIRAFSLIGK